VGPRQYVRRKSNRQAVKPADHVCSITVVVTQDRDRGFMGMTDRLSSLFTTRGPFGMGIRRRVIDRMRSVNDAPRIAWPVPPGEPADGSGWSSRSAVRTGRLRRSPAVHSRPIDLVVFQEPSYPLGNGNLVLKRASRLDAFSAYPFPTWLPDDAPSGTAGTPEVGPPQSSRTRGDPSQVSYAHGR
jgi:hypothetical protein